MYALNLKMPVLVKKSSLVAKFQRKTKLLEICVDRKISQKEEIVEVQNESENSLSQKPKMCLDINVDEDFLTDLF